MSARRSTFGEPASIDLTDDRPTHPEEPRTERASGIGDILHGELDHERAVLPALSEPSAGRLRRAWLALGRSAERRAERTVRALLVLVLGLYLVWSPLLDQRVGTDGAWSIYGVGFATGLACLLGLPRRGSLPLLLLAGFWTAWALLTPAWSAWWPTGHIVTREGRAMLACALASLGLAGLARTSRPGVEAVRRLWLVVTATVVPMGLWEVLTHQHYSPAGPYLPPPWSPAAVFTNPNNFACVLVVGLGVVLVRMTERIRPWFRVALGLLALACVLLIVLTLSRLALLATGFVILAGAVLAWQRLGHRGPSAWIARHPITSRLVALVALAAAVSSFVVPAFVRYNPVVRMLFPGDEATVRADGLREQLIRIGIDQWLTNPWFGIGGGRFEVVVRREYPEVGRVIPLHNGFLELLTEYGLLLSLPLLVLLVALAWAGLGSVRRTRLEPMRTGRPTGVDAAGGRVLLGMYLVGFVLAGVVTSSPLLWFPWWMMLASATATAGWLTRR